MSRIKQLKTIIILSVLLTLLLWGDTVKVLAYGVMYNMDTLAVLKSTAGAPDDTLFNLYMWPQTGRFATYQKLFPCAAEGFKTWLAIQANQPELAVASFATSPCVQARYTFPDMNWKVSNRLLTGGNIGWSSQRQIAVHTMFLNALQEQKLGELEKALTWFQKGIILAPGRIPDYVRQNYYKTLAEWYAYQSDDLQAQKLSAKASCLIQSDKACLNALSHDDLEDWLISHETSYISEDGWQLIALEIDRDVLAFGLEVRGRLVWQREEKGKLVQIVQDFLVPNLAPNSGFEIKDLFKGNCVAGYVGSHLYVLPCVSYARSEQYDTLLNRVAVIETQDKVGYALTSSTFPIKAGSSYIVGSKLCADGGAGALVGRDLINVPSDGKTETASVLWLFFQDPLDSDSSCWQQHLFFVEPFAEAQEFRLRLQSAASSVERAGHAMFEDVFFFEIPTVEIN